MSGSDTVRYVYGVPIPENPDELRQLDPEEFAQKIAAIPALLRSVMMDKIAGWDRTISMWKRARDQGDEERQQRLEAVLAGELEGWLDFTIPEDMHTEVSQQLARCHAELQRRGVL